MNSSIRNIIIFGAITILCLLGIQAYWLLNAWKLEENAFDQSVQIALRSTAGKLAKFNNSDLPTQELVKRIKSNYYVVNINDNIDANTLELFLLQEFDRHAINLDFEYAIYDCSNDQMVYGNYCDIDEASSELNDNTLPKYDEFIYYFGVQFPTKRNFIIGTLNLAIAFSLITLLLSSFFIYSIFIILKQRRVSELQKDFINNMTHEFKTPISSIKLASEVLLKDQKVGSDPRLLQYSKIINDQNKRLNDQVEIVLNLAKTEKDQFKLNLQKLNLHQILQQVISNSQGKITESNATLNQNYQAKNDGIRADQLHLTNVIHNLLDNSIKYSNVDPQIFLETQNVNGSVQLSFKDKGIGISKNQLDKIFDKFFRVPTGNVHNVKGFGLGLYYVKNICDAHGWDIQVESEPGQGTEIVLSIKNK